MGLDWFFLMTDFDHCQIIMLLPKQLQEGQRMCCQPTESNRVFTALVRLQTDVHALQTPDTMQ